MRHDIVADVLSAIKNAENVGKPDVMVPASNVVKELLRVAQGEGYVGDYEWIDDKKSGTFKINLLGKITDCGAIKPRYSVGINELTKWEKRYLPSRNFGILVISTPKGIMTHNQAREKNTGGVLLSYFY